MRERLREHARQWKAVGLVTVALAAVAADAAGWRWPLDVFHRVVNRPRSTP